MGFGVRFWDWGLVSMSMSSFSTGVEVGVRFHIRLKFRDEDRVQVSRAGSWYGSRLEGRVEIEFRNMGVVGFQDGSRDWVLEVDLGSRSGSGMRIRVVFWVSG